MLFSSNRVSNLRNRSNNSQTTIISLQQTPRTGRVSQLRQLARFKTVQNWLLDNLRNYCNTTSLHGFNHITRKGNTAGERIFWIAVVVLSIIVSVVLVLVSWFWNREIPTVTVIESSHYPTWNIPFPAVTICNFNKISKAKALDLAKNMKRPENVTEQEMLTFFRSTMLVSSGLNGSSVNFDTFDSILEQNNLTVNQLTERLTPDCMSMISKCIWKGTTTRCDSLFQRIVSVEGACCSFNYFGLAINFFPPKIAYQVPKRPYRVTGCGYPTGLSVLLNPYSHDYFATYYSSFGFRLFIHDAYNFPDENAETKVVTSTRESFVRINPESTYATNDIRRMDIKIRNCLFSNERRLRAMQRYSFINCLSECRLDMLTRRCGCMPLDLPNNSSIPSCSLKHLNCIINGREIFTRALPTFESTLSLVQNTKNFPCDCLPDCEGNQYPSEITTGRLNVNLAFNRMNMDKTNKVEDNILLHIFFSDLMSTRYRKEIFQNWLSSLASFGGLLGLIMGFSIVAAFEFLYFLTFRPIFNYFNNDI